MPSGATAAYCPVLLSVLLPGLVAISLMCGGDGLADIVGRRWGKVCMALISYVKQNTAQLDSSMGHNNSTVQRPLPSVRFYRLELFDVGHANATLYASKGH